MVDAFQASERGRAALEAANAPYKGSQRQTDSLVTTQYDFALSCVGTLGSSGSQSVSSRATTAMCWLDQIIALSALCSCAFKPSFTGVICLVNGQEDIHAAMS